MSCFSSAWASSYCICSSDWASLVRPAACFCLWDQIRPCCQPGQASAMLNILFTVLQRTRRLQSPTTRETVQGLVQPLCWYQESCRRRVMAKAEASCLSDTGGKRGSVYFSLWLCYWKISLTSSAYSSSGDVLTSGNQGNIPESKHQRFSKRTSAGCSKPPSEHSDLDIQHISRV